VETKNLNTKIWLPKEKKKKVETKNLNTKIWLPKEKKVETKN
jgi:hypothetical protein